MGGAFAPVSHNITSRADPLTLRAGQQLATSSVFVAVAMALAVFDITPPKDEHGKDILPEVGCSSGMLIHPTPFECVVKPRSAQAEALVRAVEHQ